MALHLPRPRSTPPPETRVGLGGTDVTVPSAAVSGVAQSQRTSRGVAGLTASGPVRSIRSQLGNEGLRRAAIDAGHKPPSDRTLRRWAQQDRIPHADIAELARRRAEIAQLGGVKAFARAIGRSESAVRRYRSGRTNALRKDAAETLRRLRARDTMATAGVLRPDGTAKRAVVSVTGTVGVRSGDTAGYDFRTRTLDFGASATPMSARESEALAEALAMDDQARAVAIIERHATLDYPENRPFDTYSDLFGFHFESISNIEIDWQ